MSPAPVRDLVDPWGEPAPELRDPARGRGEPSRHADHQERRLAHDACLHDLPPVLAFDELVQVERRVQIRRQRVRVHSPEPTGRDAYVTCEGTGEGGLRLEAAVEGDVDERLPGLHETPADLGQPSLPDIR